MKVVIIGSGNVATVLGRRLKQNNHEIVQVISRNEIHAKALADELGGSYADVNGNVNQDADIYLVAISDGSLYSLKNWLHLGKKLVVHTAGSVPIEVLKDISENYGVLYPLQSLRKEIEPDNPITLLIDGNNDHSLSIIREVANSISIKVSRMNDEERLKLHVAAVVVSNFTNHLYALTESFCNSENVDFNLLAPLIKETAARIGNFSPTQMQTGPAVRNDVFTLDKHLRLLTNHPRLRYIYLKLTDSILNEK